MRLLTKRFLCSTLALLCGGTLLLACSTPPSGAGAAQTAASAADASYRRGRSLHLAQHHDEAIAAYQEALRLAPGHVNAGNGLAIAYAEQRRFALAIPIWNELTRGATMASGPAVAFLFSNLGYAHLLNGEREQAVTALEKACLLDPLNAGAWQTLGEALQQSGQEERARQMLRQAGALREHDLRADYAVVKGERPAMIAKALSATHAPGQEGAFVEIASTGKDMFELRRVPALVPRKAPEPVPLPRPAGGDPLIVAALEISNGNGRQGMARLLSRQIRDPGLKVVRLSNEKGFAVRQTRIEYSPAFRDAAERLARRFSTGTPVAAETGKADLRLVLGRDWNRERIDAGSVSISQQ